MCEAEAQVGAKDHAFEQNAPEPLVGVIGEQRAEQVRAGVRLDRRSSKIERGGGR